MNSISTLYWLLLCSFVLLIFLLTLLNVRYRRRIRKLESSLREQETITQPKQMTTREEVLQKARNLLVEKREDLYVVSDSIRDSEVYRIIQEHIKAEEVIPESSDIWKDLELIVESAYPSFQRYVHLLIGEKVSDINMRTILLIKCGLTPTDLTKVLGRAKSSIATSRRTLMARIFDKDAGAKDFDIIIKGL